MKNSDNPVHPVFNNDGKLTTCPDYLKGNTYLSKREYFAAMAMQGYLASYGPRDFVNAKYAAEKAVECADALLTELNKESDAND